MTHRLGADRGAGGPGRRDGQPGAAAGQRLGLAGGGPAAARRGRAPSLSAASGRPGAAGRRRRPWTAVSRPATVGPPAGRGKEREESCEAFKLRGKGGPGLGGSVGFQVERKGTVALSMGLPAAGDRPDSEADCLPGPARAGVQPAGRRHRALRSLSNGQSVMTGTVRVTVGHCHSES
jgi:hypothetical protein